MDTKTCRHCGSVFPATSEFFVVDKRQSDGLLAVCRTCLNKRKRDLYAKDPSKKTRYHYEHRDEILKKKKEYYSKNKEAHKSRMKKWNEENKERHNEIGKKWKLNNPDKVRAYSAKRYQRVKERHAELTKRWKQEHKDIRNHHWQLRRARKQGVVSDLTFDQWEYIKNYFDNKCAYCGKETKMTQDHFIPIVNGGGHTKSNIVPCCLSCNCSKSTKLFNEWYPTYRHYSKEREEKILSFIQAHKS